MIELQQQGQKYNLFVSWYRDRYFALQIFPADITNGWEPIEPIDVTIDMPEIVIDDDWAVVKNEMLQALTEAGLIERVLYEIGESSATLVQLDVDKLLWK